MVTTTGFRETVDSSMAFHPLLYSASPSDRGVFMGPKLGEHSAYHFDAWDWMEDGVSDSTVEIWCGSKNRGKSAANKAHARRIRLRRANRLGRIPRIMAFDLKPEKQEEELSRDEEGRLAPSSNDAARKKRRLGEWRPLAVGYGCTPNRVAVANANFMHADFELTFGENLRQLQFLIEQDTNQTLVPDQLTALKTAVWLMREGDPALRPGFDHAFVGLRRLKYEEVAGYMRSVDGELLEQAKKDPYYNEDLIKDFERILAEEPYFDWDNVRRAASEMAAALDTARQKYGAMFAGTESPYGVLSQDIVVHDCDNLSDDDIAVFQSQLRIIRSSGVRRDDENLRVDVEVHEENYSSWGQVTYARDMLPYIKTIRKDGTNVKLIVQYPSDYESVGAAGSEQRNKALAMLSNVDHMFMSRMPEPEIDWVHNNVFRMTAPERLMVAHLGVGDFGHKPMPHHPVQFFHKKLCASDWPYVESNSALRDRQG